MMRRFVTMSLAALALSAAAATAQEAKQCEKKCPAREALAQVGLSEQQQKDVDALFAACKAKGDCPKQKPQGECDKHHAGPHAHGQAPECRKQMDEKLKAILTPEQFAQFQAAMKANCPKGHGHGQGHGQGQTHGHGDGHHAEK